MELYRFHQIFAITKKIESNNTHPRVTQSGVVQLRSSLILVATHERKTRGNAGRHWLPVCSRYNACRSDIVLHSKH
jgi:hypothetical protein